MVSPAAIIDEHSSGERTSLISRRFGTIGCLCTDVVFGPLSSGIVAFCDAKRTAGCRFGGLRCAPDVVSTMRNLFLRLGGHDLKMLPSSTLARVNLVGVCLSRRSHVLWRAMVPGSAVMFIGVGSVGPVTRRTASSTCRSSWSLGEESPATVIVEGSTWIARPLMTSSARTQRHKAPREGVSLRMRISASKTLASVNLVSDKAAEIRAVRLLPSGSNVTAQLLQIYNWMRS